MFFTTSLLPFQLVELDHEIVDVLQIGNFVHTLESFQQGLFRYEKHMDSEFEHSIQQSNCSCVVALFVEQIETAVSEVHNEQVEMLLLII